MWDTKSNSLETVQIDGLDRMLEGVDLDRDAPSVNASVDGCIEAAYIYAWVRIVDEIDNCYIVVQCCV